jgi:uncharacterized protein YxjI
MDLMQSLQGQSELMVVQKKELAELFGYESRNKYAIEAQGQPLAFAAEQSQGFMGALLRQWMGHWRTFEIQVVDNSRTLLFRAVHPFRWFFQRLDVFAANGQCWGAIQQRFAFFSKRFDVLAPDGQVLLSVSSPLWKPWTFSFLHNNSEVARVEKKWGGMLTEMFTDADRFRVLFSSPQLPVQERVLVVLSALFIDLQYFEKKA